MCFLTILIYIAASVIIAGIGYLFLGAVFNTILEAIYLFEDIFSKKEKETSTDEIKDDNNDDNGMREFFD